MTIPQAVVFASLAWLMVELVRGRRKPATVFALVAFAFVMLDYISLPASLKQLTNSGLVTVVVLLLLSVVLDKSRMLEVMAESRNAQHYHSLPTWQTCCLFCIHGYSARTWDYFPRSGKYTGNKRHQQPQRLQVATCGIASLGRAAACAVSQLKSTPQLGRNGQDTDPAKHS